MPVEEEDWVRVEEFKDGELEEKEKREESQITATAQQTNAAEVMQKEESLSPSRVQEVEVVASATAEESPDGTATKSPTNKKKTTSAPVSGESSSTPVSAPAIKFKIGEVDAEGWTIVTDDGEVRKRIMEEGSGPCPPPLTRVYATVIGMLSESGRTFVDSKNEEDDFMLGQAQMPKGVEIAVTSMKTGEKAAIKMGPGYGYSKARQPAGFAAGSALEFIIRIARFEKEKNLHEMSIDEKFEFCEQRREIGKVLFKEGKPKTAFRQYTKALIVLDDQKLSLHSDAKKHRMLFLVNQANCKLKLNEDQDVIALCNKALALGESTKAYYLRGQAYRKLGDWVEAVSDFTNVQSSSPDKVTLDVVTRELAYLKDQMRKQTERERKSLGGFLNHSEIKGKLYDDIKDVVVPVSWGWKLYQTITEFVCGRCKRKTA